MRPVHLTDLDIAAQIVLAWPVPEQCAIAAEIVAGARLADRFRKRLRRRHPVWGDGTLAAAAQSRGAAVAAPRRDAAYRQALMNVLRALLDTEGFDYPHRALYGGQISAVRNVCDGP